MTQPLHVVTHASVAGSQSVPPPQVAAPAVQASAASSHVSAPLQEMPSEHTRAAPPQVVPVQTSPSVQNRPSSQLAPSLLDQPAADVAGSQTSHWFAGLRCPAPKHVPPITQPVQDVTQVSDATSQVSSLAQVDAPG